MVFPMENVNNIFIIDGSSNNYISKSKKVFNSFISALKELKETIYSNVEKIVHNDPFLDKLILTLKDSFNNIDSILSKMYFLEDEYYDYSSIKDMIFYILDDKSLLSNISLFEDLIDSFYNLIQFKFDLSDEDYKVKYDDFSSKLINIEQIFYTSICKPSEKYDEKVLSEITNSLLDL